MTSSVNYERERGRTLLHTGQEKHDRKSALVNSRGKYVHAVALESQMDTANIINDANLFPSNWIFLAFRRFEVPVSSKLFTFTYLSSRRLHSTVCDE